jgi:hypothetical protein
MTQLLLLHCETENAARGIQEELENLNFSFQGMSQERALTGVEWEMLLALPVTGVLVREVARVILAWLEANAARRAKLGEVELRGYSADGIEKILDAHSRKKSD